MDNIGNYILCGVILLICLAGFLKKIPVFDTFLSGGREGLNTAASILPSLIGLTTAISMFMASGVGDLFSAALAPLTEFFGIPRETLPLALMRPISGSGALAVYRQLIDQHGPDSLIGNVASVMMGSTETTFYTIAVYFGSQKITHLRHTLPAALAADLTGFIFSALTVRFFLM